MKMIKISQKTELLLSAKRKQIVSKAANQNIIKMLTWYYVSYYPKRL